MDFSVLHNPTFTISLILCSYFQYKSFFYLKGLPVFKLPKQFSWITTTLSSLTMTFASLPFLKAYIGSKSNLNNFELLVTIFFCAYFISYLLADMIFGFMYYPEHMDIVTGWFHHTLYLFLLPIIIANKVEGVFMIAAFMELPTCFLAIGYLIPSLRSENAFRISFFITRILFHLHFARSVKISWPQRPECFWLATVTFPLHIFWFGKWVKRQLNFISIETKQKTCLNYPVLKLFLGNLLPDEEEVDLNDAFNKDL